MLCKLRLTARHTDRQNDNDFFFQSNHSKIGFTFLPQNTDKYKTTPPPKKNPPKNKNKNEVRQAKGIGPDKYSTLNQCCYFNSLNIQR